MPSISSLPGESESSPGGGGGGGPGGSSSGSTSVPSIIKLFLETKSPVRYLRNKANSFYPDVKFLMLRSFSLCIRLFREYATTPN